jgi:hypothetical protein
MLCISSLSFTDICGHNHKTKLNIIHINYYIYVHELKQPDCASKIYFDNWLLQNVQDGIMAQQQQFISNEALP